ncbi:TetR/AcrR family transcriptional regulator [Naasia lichenicola]|uniref:TetR/AcrR family transcriptional regulator n=1 Tax=Naasia lichenicola TaxID=2565933 RepID=A0A4S4FSJ2_9MICO|nr:TetR/AcrR family transcriptional regulator [Naasia lichenicola]THG33271.1 TetR/AcrR family transcriptional regulator [Naasia lichenicola]
MGRPSVADARRRQILEAAIRCLANNGLAATTLDGIAAEAGMARGHVRHFAGNRDEILAAAATLLYLGEVPGPDAVASGEPVGSFLPAGTTTVEAALDYLFGGFAEPGPENVAALAFIDASRSNERIREVVTGAYLTSLMELQHLLTAAAPSVEADRVNAVAYGVLTVALGNVFMADLEVSPARTELARKNAEALIAAVVQGL